jgi:hypothetical protein
LVLAALSALTAVTPSRAATLTCTITTSEESDDALVERVDCPQRLRLGASQRDAWLGDFRFPRGGWKPVLPKSATRPQAKRKALRAWRKACANTSAPALLDARMEIAYSPAHFLGEDEVPAHVAVSLVCPSRKKEEPVLVANGKHPLICADTRSVGVRNYPSPIPWSKKTQGIRCDFEP